MFWNMNKGVIGSESRVWDEEIRMMEVLMRVERMGMIVKLEDARVDVG